MSLPALDNLVRIDQLKAEGLFQVEESAIAELCELTGELVAEVEKLTSR